MLSGKEAHEIILKQVKPKPEKKIAKPIEKRIEPKKEVKEKPSLKPKPTVKIEKKEEKRVEKPKKETKADKEVPKQEVQKELGKTREELEQEKDIFFKKVKDYLYENDIDIIDYKIIRKKSDIDLSVAVHSRIGSQEYYCKAKKKKKVNDGDLSSAYIQGQAKKLPVIFITTGELTKKAKEMFAKDFKGMVVKKI